MPPDRFLPDSVVLSADAHWRPESSGSPCRKIPAVESHGPRNGATRRGPQARGPCWAPGGTRRGGHEQAAAAAGRRALAVGPLPLRGVDGRGGPGAVRRTRVPAHACADAAPLACVQVKVQRFFHDAAPPGHPGISITRPTPSQRLRFGDFGRRLAPSGEVLAWLLAKGTWDFTGKRVLELVGPASGCPAWPALRGQGAAACS